MSKPNLFIIGAMKSGTTSLHNYLDAHPRIAMSREKEPGYFLRESPRAEEQQTYLGLFSSDGNCSYRGESSTHYTKLPTYPGVAERIHRFNPDSRLIYVMRHPFERTVSHYWHAVRDIHHGGEVRPILRAVSEQSEYLAFSHYAMQLRPYLDLFDTSAVYTLTFEELLQDPNGETNKIFAWLGLNEHDIPEDARRAHNQRPDTIIGVSGNGTLNRIEYSSVWARVSPLVPRGLKRLARTLAYKKVDDRISDEDVARLRSMIEPRQQQEIEELSLLLGRDFPEWS